MIDSITNELYSAIQDNNVSIAKKVLNFTKKSNLLTEVLYNIANKLQDDILNDDENAAYKIINWAKYNHVCKVIFEKINNKLHNAINIDDKIYVTKVLNFAHGNGILKEILTYKYHDGRTLLFICVEKRDKIQFCSIILDKAYEAGVLMEVLAQKRVWEDGNKFNQTSLQAALYKKNTEAVSIILNKAEKAKILVDVLTQHSTIKNIDGDEFTETALSFVIKHKNIEIINEILQKGNAKILSEILTQNRVLNFDGTCYITISSPLYIAIEENYTEAIYSICKKAMKAKVTQNVFQELADYLRYLLGECDDITLDNVTKNEIANRILDAARYCGLNSLQVLIKGSYTSWDTCDSFSLTEHYLVGLHNRNNNTILQVLYELHNHNLRELDEFLNNLLY